MREETRGHQMMQGNTEPIEPLCIKKDGKLYANRCADNVGREERNKPTVIAAIGFDFQVFNVARVELFVFIESHKIQRHRFVSN